MSTLSAAVLALLAASKPDPALRVDSEPSIPVLLITGANNHDWEWTSVELATILHESGRFDVEVTREPAKTLADAEGLKRYKAFLLDYNGPRWGEPAETNFVAAVRGGTGVSVIHAADNAFPGWKEYEEIVGLLWREYTGHGQFHAFDVRVAERTHPITLELPNLRLHPDELYHTLVNVTGAKLEVLATAFSDPKTGGTKRDEPMIVVSQYGAGRVFHTPLGHAWAGQPGTHVSMLDPQFRDLVVRGTEWAATGDVRANGRKIELFNGKSLAGWKPLGDARYTVDDGSILGEVGGGSQSFLASERSYGDFELEVELKVERPGSNSGIQIRSHVNEQGRMYGYQIEIDPTERRWSGGLYDEARRGWLDDLSDNEAGQQAFRPGDWNHYRIVCEGPWIRARVNDVATADFLDALDLEGQIGLQVHSGKDTRVRWRNFSMRESGRRQWLSLDALAAATARPAPDAAAGAAEMVCGALAQGGTDLALRIRYQPDQRFVIALRGSAQVGQLPDDGSIMAPGLKAGKHSLLFDPADPAFEQARNVDGVNELVLMAFGYNFAADLNGKRVCSAVQTVHSTGELFLLRGSFDRKSFESGALKLERLSLPR